MKITPRREGVQPKRHNTKQQVARSRRSNFTFFTCIFVVLEAEVQFTRKCGKRSFTRKCGNRSFTRKCGVSPERSGRIQKGRLKRPQGKSAKEPAGQNCNAPPAAALWERGADRARKAKNSARTKPGARQPMWKSVEIILAVTKKNSAQANSGHKRKPTSTDTAAAFNCSAPWQGEGIWKCAWAWSLENGAHIYQQENATCAPSMENHRPEPVRRKTGPNQTHMNKRWPLHLRTAVGREGAKTCPRPQ